MTMICRARDSKMLLEDKKRLRGINDTDSSYILAFFVGFGVWVWGAGGLP